jgi:hypothetical protein
MLRPSSSQDEGFFTLESYCSTLPSILAAQTLQKISLLTVSWTEHTVKLVEPAGGFF